MVRLKPSLSNTGQPLNGMGMVFARKTMSLDGYIADKDDGVGRLMHWYRSGDTEYTLDDGMVFKVSAASFNDIQDMMTTTGAIVGGRRDYDISQYGDEHPMGIPHFVVTHQPPGVKASSWFTFVTDGVESAVKQAQQAAGAKHVAVTGAKIVQQCLMAGLLDEIHIDLVPLLLGDGILLFENLGSAHLDLEQLTVIEAPGVTHLKYRIIK
jgi:dihydrofolate reductase